MKCTFLLILSLIFNSTIYTSQENIYKMDYPDDNYYPEITDYAEITPVIEL